MRGMILCDYEFGFTTKTAKRDASEGADLLSRMWAVRGSIGKIELSNYMLEHLMIAELHLPKVVRTIICRHFGLLTIHDSRGSLFDVSCCYSVLDGADAGLDAIVQTLVAELRDASCFFMAGLLPTSVEMIEGFSMLKTGDQDDIKTHTPSGNTGSGSGDSMVDKKIQDQNKKIFEVQEILGGLKDKELREMLELNGLPTTKLGVGLKEVCADGILFGPSTKLVHP